MENRRIPNNKKYAERHSGDFLTTIILKKIIKNQELATTQKDFHLNKGNGYIFGLWEYAHLCKKHYWSAFSKKHNGV